MGPPECKKAKITSEQTLSGHESFFAKMLEWSKTNELTMSEKVFLATKNSAHRYAMFAKADISKNEILFEVPR